MVEHKLSRTLMTPVSSAEEKSYEQSLRPQTLRQYIGQQKVKDNIEISIHAALKRQEALDHVLLYGPRDWARRRWQPSLPMK